MHTVAHSDMVDASGHMWQCADTLYDEGVAAGIPKPDAGWATTDTTYSNCANQSGTAIKTYTGYDTWGDTVRPSMELQRQRPRYIVVLVVP